MDADDGFELVTRSRKGNKKKINDSSKKNRQPDQSESSSGVAQQNDQTGEQRRSFNRYRNIIYGEPIVDDDVSNGIKVSRTQFDAIATNLIRNFPTEEEQQSSEESVEQKTESTPEKLEPPAELGDYNKRPLPSHATTYELEKFEKNALLIFNHKDIIGYAPRLGTEKDTEELEKTFKQFGFEVEVKDDLTKDQIIDTLKTFMSRDFSDYGCVGVVVLTHGTKGGRIKAKDMSYSERELVSQLMVRTRPTLVTKPRLFITQACRGTKVITGVPVGFRSALQKDSHEEIEPYMLPDEADILELHSSYSGKPSLRDEVDGSWFIQSLCRKINQMAATHDLESILTEVKREVAIDRWHVERNRRTNEHDVIKQIPVTTSTLTRKLYLRSYKCPPSTATDGIARAPLLDSAPPTPLLPIRCMCFLDHYTYIASCLGHYLTANPDDKTARVLMSITGTFKGDVTFDDTKAKTAKEIYDHLKEKCGEHPYSNFLYPYKHE